MKYGINLYGVLKDRKDTFAALQELRENGFSFIEPCIAPDVIPSMEHVFWPVKWLEENLGAIRDLGFEIPSAHLTGWDYAAQKAQIKSLAEDFGITRLVVKSPSLLTNESLNEAAMTYMTLADYIEPSGAKLLIHNELDDIKTKIAGKTSYEHLLYLCNGKVGAQVDSGWALAGGEDPAALLWRLGSLVESLHYKDFVSASEGLTAAPVGKGSLDVTSCYQFARLAGINQLVDMDEFGPDPAADLKDSLEMLRSQIQERNPSISYLNILDVETGIVKTVRSFDRVIEAPNWLKKSSRIVYNSDGHIFIYDLDTGVETMIDTGECDNCNNDHVISPEEDRIAVSHSPKDEPGASYIYILPLEGGTPSKITPNAPSYLHGWSPDGKELAYCAFRKQGNETKVNIYVIPADGGEEKPVTTDGFNDGPEYSPDGKYIWFNSTRTGLMQIWRMKRDGTEQTQMTFNERNNWFAHVSPDGSKAVYLSYRKGDLEPAEHLPNMQVELWLMNTDGSDQRRILSFTGGQGSINVNSWSKDSRHIAFVSYEILHGE